MSFLIAMLMLPWAESSIRAPLSCTISATDATVERSGACVAGVNAPLAHLLFQRAEKRGEHVRLNWDAHDIQWLPCRLAKPTGDLDAIIMALNWRRPWAGKFKHLYHINVQEVEAVVREIDRRCREGERDIRIHVAIDSRVATGAIGKGRSSSSILNRSLSSFLRIFIGYGVSVSVVWVSTKANPADAPSRMPPLPKPGPMPTWAHRLFTGLNIFGREADRNQKALHTSREGACGFRFREYFAGSGNLSKHLSHAGAAADSIEAYPENGMYIATHDLTDNTVIMKEIALLKDGNVDAIHIGTPCRTWRKKSMLNPNGSRTASRPWGDGVSTRELEANIQATNTYKLIMAQLSGGGFFSLEQPRDSLLLETDIFKEILCIPGVFTVVFDQCEFDLSLPKGLKEVRMKNVIGTNLAENLDDAKIKKPTIIVTNIPKYAQLGRRCQGGHRHVHAVGKIRVDGIWRKISELAGAYPDALCSRMASLVVSSWKHP